ncbi:GNAT family N-acetyltransferase [Micrococcus luteus]|uniref:GNAT family N-acetyltransferase n=1 Tax=Micrococcus TaxID=1269 RepID=UPI0019D0CA0A|nr:GNAT family N-acetyltransferase [Micrococcus luteus]MBN6750265.1 GNAT family N-acetyltransferase [Micrococcus luteus]MBN6760062.1 GNAT family N-acetyltransferase [Micrococcus luteus]MBN6801844.1 GNAT family N-acetyltransferase [Micrococcus luteus]MBU8650178.1 GNAT family N-acetyltransferase [Micrococcus luteus]
MTLYPRVKRVGDATLAGLGLVVTAPLMAATAAAVAVKLGRPVLFAQPRPGRDGRVFTMYKFRSMLTPDAEAGRITNEDRMTPFGALLRSTSLDELPSLWNVVKGDMSLVGPRPLRQKYLGRYSDTQRTRHSVRPGLTGLAQVSGRNALSWDDRFDLDVQYVASMSALLDLKIIARTVSKVLRRDGVQEEGQATMSEFFGPTRVDGLTLRRLASDDLSDRVEWLRDPSVRAGITIDFWPTLDGMRSWYQRASRNEHREDFVCVEIEDGTPLAMTGWTDEADGVAELYIYVRPQAQGRGVGRRTLQMLEARARQAGLTQLLLETKRANAAACRLYEGLGYVVDPGRSTETKIAMKKEL